MRSSAADLDAAAVDDLAWALAHCGLTSEATPGVPELVIAAPGGPFPVEVRAAAATDTGRVRHLIESRTTTSEAVPVLVGDLIPAQARAALRAAGWGYLDRRGALWLRTASVMINDTALAPLPRLGAPPSGEAINGRIALGVAVTLLMHPDDELGPRELARRLDCAPSTASDAVRRLQDHALVDRGRRPLVPELFQVTSAAWRPERRYVLREPIDANLPAGSTAERFVLSGDVAAIELGAPVVAAGPLPPLVYVSNPATLRRLERELGPAEPADAAAVLSAAPFPAVVDEDSGAGEHWRRAHPVIVALDLAQDPARGGEILDDWTPRDHARVW